MRHRVIALSLNSALRANFIGRLTTGVVSLAITPVYLKLLGAEGYGLIGFYMLVQSVLSFANAGLADAANREAARLEQTGAGAETLRGYAWSVWLIGLAVWVLLVAGSGLMATHWITAEHLSLPALKQALRWVAVLVALQVPFDFYIGVGLGARHYLMANSLLAGTTISRAVVGAGVMWQWGGEPWIFFVSQAGVLASAVIVGEWDFSRHFPASGRAQVVTDWLALWRVPAGMTGVALTGMLLGQLDRLVLSRALKLEDFGYYSIATMLANTLYLLIGPIQASYYPEFSRLTAAGDTARLTRLYHEACQRMAVAVLPAGAVLIFFARDVVLVWTTRTEVADLIAPTAALLVCARLVSSLNTLPYTLQFAHGWTSLVLKANLLALIALAPAVVVLAGAYGAVGAALGYFLLSLPFLAGIVWRMHRRLLPGEAGRWLWYDNAPYVIISFLVAGVCKLTQPHDLSGPARLVWLIGASTVTLGGTCCAYAPARRKIRQGLRLLRGGTLS